MGTLFIKQIIWQGILNDPNQHAAISNICETVPLAQGSPWLDTESVFWRAFDDGGITPDDAARFGCVAGNLGLFPDFSTSGTYAEVFARVVEFCAEKGIVYNDPQIEYDEPWENACAENTDRIDVMAGNGIPDDWVPYE